MNLHDRAGTQDFSADGRDSEFGETRHKHHRGLYHTHFCKNLELQFVRSILDFFFNFHMVVTFFLPEACARSINDCGEVAAGCPFIPTQSFFILHHD